MEFNELFFQFLCIFNFAVIIKSAKSENSSESVENGRNIDVSVCLINSSVVGKQILGAHHESENGVEYCAFLGIPYARPPTNHLRFKPPEPTEFVYDAISKFISPGYPCIFSKHFGTTFSVQSEDCLYLNIFIPVNILRSDRLSAVVVWIHGGSYNVGSGLSDMHPTRGPETYIEHGMIFVSFNYRLGPLGFLRVPELNITGNYGLMDQRFALKWIHQNIYLWNGDKNNVTLMGWSAGSSSVSYHLLASESNQYFVRAILMSGTLLNPWAQYDHPEICLSQLLKRLKIKRSQIANLLSINGTDFDRNRSLFFSFGSIYECFVPIIDHIIVGDTINYKLSTRVDIMIGWTSLESQHFDMDLVTMSRKFNPFHYLKFLNQTRDKVRLLLHYLENEFYNNTENYLDTNTVDWASNDTEVFYRLSSKLIADNNVKYGIRNFIKNVRRANGPQSLNIFVYQFSYDGQFFMNHKFNDGLEGAGHGDDLAYLFRTEQNLRGNNTNYDGRFKNELFIQRSLLTMWTNFMKHGNPTPTPIAASPNNIELTVIWENYKSHRQFLDINLQIRMVPDADDAFYLLWVRLENCIRHDVCSFLRECVHCV